MIRALSVAAVLALATAASLPARADDVDDSKLNWQFVPGYHRPIEMAIVSGDPAQPGPFVVRFRMPSGMKWSPHRYSNTREMKILKGIFWLTPGESYNWRDMNEYKAGTVLTKEAGQPYFGWARTAVVLEESGEGPSVIEYVNAEDDPRNKRKRRGAGSSE